MIEKLTLKSAGKVPKVIVAVTACENVLQLTLANPDRAVQLGEVGGTISAGKVTTSWSPVICATVKVTLKV